MKKVMHVEGMMCPRCEARVKKALEALDFVESALPEREHSRVTVTLSAPGSDAVLTQTVTDAGYQVTGIDA